MELEWKMAIIVASVLAEQSSGLATDKLKNSSCFSSSSFLTCSFAFLKLKLQIFATSRLNSATNLARVLGVWGVLTTTSGFSLQHLFRNDV